MCMLMGIIQQKGELKDGENREDNWRYNLLNIERQWDPRYK